MDERGQDDKQWFKNVEGCLNNDIPFGVYLYSYATDTGRASNEADHALRLLDEAGLDPPSVAYPIYFDMEDVSTLNSDHAAIATTFCNKIEAAGYEAGIYSSTSWFNNRLADPCFNNWTKWVAQWNASMGLTCSGLLDFSSGNGMWQFSDYGSVPGINGASELNYTYMDPRNVVVIDNVYQESEKPYEAPLPDGKYIINTVLSVNSVVDIVGASCNDGAVAQIYTSNNNKVQEFVIESDKSTGFYKIKNVRSENNLGLHQYASGCFGAAVA